MIVAKSRLFRASLLVASFMILGLALASCGASGGGQTAQTSSQATTSSSIAMDLKFPDGYAYNKANGGLSVAGAQASRLASYVTRITLTISGNGIAPLTVEVPLDTMAVTVFLSKGIYTFTLTVYTSIGVTFTATSVGEIGSTPPAISFDLDVNSPPTLDSLTGGGVISTSQRATLIASASDLDDDDTLTYTWSSNGGSLSGSGNTATFSSGTPGTYTISVLVSDGHGGTATGNAQVRVVSANSAPSITALTLDGEEYYFTGSGSTLHRVGVFDPAISLYNQGAAYNSCSANIGATGNYVPLSHKGNVTNGIKLSCSASDPNGDTLTYKLTTTFLKATLDGNNIVTGTSQTVIAPADVSKVSAVNTFTGPVYLWDVTPFVGVWGMNTYNNVQLMDVTCTVSDGNGGSATLTNRYAAKIPGCA